MSVYDVYRQGTRSHVSVVINSMVQVLTRQFQCAGYIVQENIETGKGFLSCSHLIETAKVTQFIRYAQLYVQNELFVYTCPHEAYDKCEYKHVCIYIHTFIKERYEYIHHL